MIVIRYIQKANARLNSTNNLKMIKKRTQFPKKRQMSKTMIESKRELFEYFEDDDIDHLKVIDDEFFYYDDIVVFSYSQYFEFFIIHLLSFVILGPFISLYTYIFKGNPQLMYNL
jgi:hypothetical protein